MHWLHSADREHSNVRLTVYPEGRSTSSSRTKIRFHAHDDAQGALNGGNHGPTKHERDKESQDDKYTCGLDDSRATRATTTTSSNALPI